MEQQSSEQACEISFRRPSKQGWMQSINVTIDGSTSIKVGAFRTASIKVPAGHHLLKGACGYIKSEPLDVDLVSGATAYVAVQIAPLGERLGHQVDRVLTLFVEEIRHDKSMKQ